MDDKEIRLSSQKLVKSKAAWDIQIFWGTSGIWNIISFGLEKLQRTSHHILLQCSTTKVRSYLYEKKFSPDITFDPY